MLGFYLGVNFADLEFMGGTLSSDDFDGAAKFGVLMTDPTTGSIFEVVCDFLAAMGEGYKEVYGLITAVYELDSDGEFIDSQHCSGITLSVPLSNVTSVYSKDI